MDPRIPDGAIVGGVYRVLRYIGRGGMGQVYEVENTRFGGHFALKVPLDGPHRARLRREIDALRATHPNIVRVVDTGDLDGAPFIVMELLQGRSLAEVARERRRSGQPRMPLERVVSIVGQIASALDRSHAEGIVHRDLKPENLFLTERAGIEDHVTVLDFGNAKRSSEPPGSTDLTLTGPTARAGTLPYMAPEQIEVRLDAPIDERADQFALAVMTYELIADVHPFAGQNNTDLVWKIVHASPPPLPELDCEESVRLLIEQVLGKALSKHPGDRYDGVLGYFLALRAAVHGRCDVNAAMNAATDDLQPFGGAGSVDLALSAPASRSRPSTRRARAALLVATVVLILGAGVAFRIGTKSESSVRAALPAALGTIAPRPRAPEPAAPVPSHSTSRAPDAASATSPAGSSPAPKKPAAKPREPRPIASRQPAVASAPETSRADATPGKDAESLERAPALLLPWDIQRPARAGR